MSSAAERFRRYNFDGDTKWQETLRNLTFPPGRDDLVLKRKAKFYKQEIDPSLNIDEVVIGSSVPNSEKQAPPKPQPKQRPAPPKPSASAAAVRKPVLGDVALFLGNLAMVICIALAIQPFNRFLAYRSFVNACRFSVGVHGYRLIKRAGTPSLSGFRPWLQRASSSTEFFYLITTITLQSNPAAWIGLIPMAILAVYHVSAFLNSTLGHTELWRSTGAAAGHAWLAANKEAALQASAILEVATAFQLLLSVLQTGPRALFSTYMYANQLRGRRWSPESSKYHAQAWSELGRRAAPLLRHVPILQRLVAGGQRWFQQGQRTAA